MKKYEYDGIKYESLGELKIAKFLTKNKIPFEYEKKLTMKRSYDSSKESIIYPDFFIKDKNIIIEYFGMQGNSDYDKNIESKKKTYNHNNYELISIMPNSSENSWQNEILNKSKKRNFNFKSSNKINNKNVTKKPTEIDINKVRNINSNNNKFHTNEVSKGNSSFTKIVLKIIFFLAIMITLISYLFNLETTDMLNIEVLENFQQKPDYNINNIVYSNNELKFNIINLGENFSDNVLISIYSEEELIVNNSIKLNLGKNESISKSFNLAQVYNHNIELVGIRNERYNSFLYLNNNLPFWIKGEFSLETNYGGDRLIPYTLEPGIKNKEIKFQCCNTCPAGCDVVDGTIKGREIEIYSNIKIVINEDKNISEKNYSNNILSKKLILK